MKAGTFRHGTKYAYFSRGCRCGQCATGMREWSRKQVRRDRRKAKQNHNYVATAHHGTGTTYNRGCRCRPCTEAVNAEKKKHAKRDDGRARLAALMAKAEEDPS